MLVHCRRIAVLCAVQVAVGAAGGVFTPSGADDAGARHLIEEMAQRYWSVKTEREQLDVLVVAVPQKERFTVESAKALVREGGRGVTHKRAVRHARYVEDHRDQIHVLFSLPPKDAGTGFLVWRDPTGEDKQWIYLPALKRVRRVPVSSTATFVGTNLTYEDVRELSGENVARYQYELGEPGPVDGSACTVVVARPAAGTPSAYASRKLWIDAQRQATLKIEYADDKGRTLKVLYSTGLEEVRPGVYRPQLTEVRDLLIGEVTLVWISERQVGLEIPEKIFTTDYLAHP